jgi:hypothetical protein
MGFVRNQKGGFTIVQRLASNSKELQVVSNEMLREDAHTLILCFCGLFQFKEKLTKCTQLERVDITASEVSIVAELVKLSALPCLKTLNLQSTSESQAIPVEVVALKTNQPKINISWNGQAVHSLAAIFPAPAPAAAAQQPTPCCSCAIQ